MAERRHVHRHQHDRGTFRGTWHTHAHRHGRPIRPGERITLGQLERRLSDSAPHQHAHRRRIRHAA